MRRATMARPYSPITSASEPIGRGDVRGYRRRPLMSSKDHPVAVELVTDDLRGLAAR
jgi:hypothetical protein